MRNEAPADQARYFRRLKLILLIPYLAAFVVVALIFDYFGWFTHKSVQVLFSVISLLCTLLYGLWKSNMPCPRCGWNIYLKKSNFPFIMSPVPSSCPNCGLDLEKIYGGDQNVHWVR
jgi:hypothetical protein